MLSSTPTVCDALYVKGFNKRAPETRYALQARDTHEEQGGGGGPHVYVYHGTSTHVHIHLAPPHHHVLFVPSAYHPLCVAYAFCA